jgi:gamma-glutamylcyclotransferase (GGCT)/AIG2-like uncharacterized protein YtfP
LNAGFFYGSIQKETPNASRYARNNQEPQDNTTDVLCEHEGMPRT